jgi:hypothetical protein
MLPEKLVKKKGIWDLKYLYIPISILNLLNYLLRLTEKIIHYSLKIIPTMGKYTLLKLYGNSLRL